MPRRIRPPFHHRSGHEVRYPHGRPSPEVVREAELANELRLKPRSITAELQGDPLPGRSALDARKAAWDAMWKKPFDRPELVWGDKPKEK